jgi:muramoyltetrapeptide carboxypeptidase
MNRIEPVIRPRRLKEGHCIAVVAPAGAFERDALSRGVDVVTSMGFKVRLDEKIFQQDGYFAGTDAHRAKLLQDSFLDDAVQAIFCVRGGYGSMRLLSLLDWERIAVHPKVFIGFSDVSALLINLYLRCGLVTFHGPTLNTLDGADAGTRAALLETLTTSRTVALDGPEAETLQSGSVTAPVIVGNLTTFCHLVGTPFQPSFAGHILLVEDTGEALYRIDRMLTQMRLAGCFEGMAGLALGSFQNCGSPGKVLQLFERFFEAEKFPMAGGFEFGHAGCNPTLPLGVEATLDADRRCLTYREPATL